VDAPSNTSENGSSRSPVTPMGLPPLIGDRDERRKSAVAYVPANTTGFVNSEGKFETVKPEFRPLNGPFFKEPQWNARGESQESQRSLPSFDSLRSSMENNQGARSPNTRISSILNSSNEQPRARQTQSASPTTLSPAPTSPPRSARMNIQSLI
jgi:hypothetical protein